MRTRQVSCPGGTLHTIDAGDTLYKLANYYNTSVRAIQQANPGIDPQNLAIGRQICIPVPPVPGPCPGGTIYTIKAGDTLYSLAQAYNTTVDAIIAANPGLDPRSLQVARRICIPGPSATGTCPPGGTTHTIMSGDTLYSLARRYNTTVSAIQKANPGLDPRSLQVGRKICIPTAVPCPGGSIYVIRSGDTLNAIARANNMTLNQLLSANPQIKNPDMISVGQQICVPAHR